MTAPLQALADQWKGEAATAEDRRLEAVAKGNPVAEARHLARRQLCNSHAKQLREALQSETGASQ